MSEAGHGNFRNNGEGGRGRLVDRRGEKLAEEREKERLKWPALVLSFFSGGNSFSPTLRCFLWKIYSPHFSSMWDLKDFFRFMEITYTKTFTKITL